MTSATKTLDRKEGEECDLVAGSLTNISCHTKGQRRTQRGQWGDRPTPSRSPSNTSLSVLPRCIECRAV